MWSVRPTKATGRRREMQNQMQEALMLFESICNSQWFTKTSIILFLNKIDLLKQKLAASPVKDYFPDYMGEPGSYKQASEFFQENFRRLNRNSQKVLPSLPSHPATHPVKVKPKTGLCSIGILTGGRTSMSTSPTLPTPIC